MQPRAGCYGRRWVSERWLGVPLPVWILALAGTIYLFAHRASTSVLSVAPANSFTTPPNQISQNAPQPSGAAPGTAPNYPSMTGTPYDPSAIPPTAWPSIDGPGISGSGLNTWQGYGTPPALQNVNSQ